MVSHSLWEKVFSIWMPECLLNSPTSFPSLYLSHFQTYISCACFFFQLLSRVRLFVTPWICSTPGFSVLHHLLELAQTHVHWVSDAIQPSHPLWSPSPPAFNLSQHQGLFWCIRWPKYQSFSFSISPPNEYSVLTSSRIDWFDLLAVQGTLKSLLQHQSSKASILQCSAFFMVYLLHPYMTWKNHSFD